MSDSISAKPYIFRLTALFLGLFIMGMPAEAKSKFLTDFSEEVVAKSWYSVNDSVMGGISKGSLNVSADNTLIFRGALSLENRGGFASIRTRPVDLEIDDNDTLVARVKGDGRTYYMDLRTPSRSMAASFRAPIKTKAGEWIEVRMPLSEFYFTSFGRKLDRSPISGSDVTSLGFTLSDKKPGPFKLEIAWVKAEDKDGVDSARVEATADQEAATSNIVDVATKSGQFTTLLAAVEAAGLTQALQNPEATLTVFAPTDVAFKALPDGLVESLLMPSNRDRLATILKYHVLADEVKLRREVKTLQGDTLLIRTTGDLGIGDAKIIAADIEASNGVIHVIDRVLIPALPKSTPTYEAMRLIELAINRGVPLYNAGNVQACATIYEFAAISLLSGYRDALTEAEVKQLQGILGGIRSQSPRDQAWALRGALDEIYETLKGGE